MDQSSQCMFWRVLTGALVSLLLALLGCEVFIVRMNGDDNTMRKCTYSDGLSVGK